MKNRKLFINMIMLSLFLLFLNPIFASSESFVLEGNRVFRSSQDYVSIHFLSNKSGTAFYKLTEDYNAPSLEDLSVWNNGGEVLENYTKKLDVSCDFDAKYVHIVVKSGESLSNVLTLSIQMYSYTEDFEGYPVNTYVDQGDKLLSPIKTEYGGTGNSNQKVIAEETNKFLSLSSTSSYASVQTIAFPSGYTEDAYQLIVRGKVKPLADDGPWGEAASFGIGDRKNGILFINGKICDMKKKDINNISYTLGKWYDIEFIVDLLSLTYDIKVDDKIILTDINYVLDDKIYLFAGHGTTAYFDDI